MNRLRDLREDRDLYQSELANILKMSQSNYSRYELEKTDIPTQTLKNLAKFYDTSIDYILCLTNIKEPYPRKKD